MRPGMNESIYRIQSKIKLTNRKRVFNVSRLSERVNGARVLLHLPRYMTLMAINRAPITLILRCVKVELFLRL